MTEPRRTHEREQRAAQAEDFAHEVATFYHALRRRKVPAGAAQGMAETYITERAGGDLPPEWVE